jgi:hypothetical protein
VKEALVKYAAKICSLSTSELPKSYIEQGTKIWEAFNLGRKYEREVIKEKLENLLKEE